MANVIMRATLRRTSDGVVRVYQDTYDPTTWTPPVSVEDYVGGMFYMWEDGNYGCDCNRALFFARAGGEPEPMLHGPPRPCGHGRFDLVRLEVEIEGEVEVLID